MKKALIYILVALVLTGCSWGQFNVPKQDYQAKVQVLGVLPLLVDTNAYFEYPQKEALLDLVARSAAGQQDRLVSRLRAEKGYFDVRALPGNPEMLTMSLLAGEQPRGEDGRPNGFVFNSQSVAEIAQRNVVDALLVVVLSGAQVKETRRSRTLLESLETTYNDILATAAVIDRNGKVLWQLTGSDAVRILLLQYADFDEAYYNHTDLVKVKNIGLPGLEKALDKEEDGAPPKAYQKLFDRIVSGISPGLFDSL